MASSLSSRALLFIALVAALLGCAFAHRGLLNKESKACNKAYPGCADCDEDDAGDVFCNACKDDNALPDDEAGECVCDAEGDYGTITKAQVKEYKRNNKEAEEEADDAFDNAKHNGLAFKGACVLCADFDLESVDGVCEEPLA